MDPKILTPILFGALIVFSIYRRVRRNVGRQRVRPSRMQFRIVVFSLIGALVLLGALRNVEVAGAMLAGVAGGVVLAWFGVRHTKFDVTEMGTCYTPHTYIGLFVSLLFLGRIAYRFIVVYPMMHAAAQASGNPLAAYQKSPLTMAIFGVLVGYYVAYHAGVLGRSRALPAAAPE